MHRLSFLSLIAALGCAGSIEPTPTPSLTADPELARLLASEGLGGSVAVLGSDGSLRCSDPEDCVARTPPASTFKIVNSIIALETGVAADAALVIPWDGVEREFPAWNHDLDMRAAFAASAVPYYQELARRIGAERFGEFLGRLDYGNQEIGAVVDRFWLDGPLEISPVEQLAFLERFEQGRLPITARTRGIVRELMVREQREGFTLYGKTGWASPHGAEERGWFVGYGEREGRVDYVAVRLVRAPGMTDEEFLASRMRIAREAIGEP